MASAAGVVVYASAAGERLWPVVAGVGAAGCALAALSLSRPWPSLLPLGLVGVGGAYGVRVVLHGGAVDAAAPAIAAVLFATAELGYWSLERGAPYDRLAALRRVGFVIAGALVTALAGSLVLVAASGVSGGVSLEAAGVVAALLTLGAIALLASRASV